MEAEECWWGHSFVRGCVVASPGTEEWRRRKEVALYRPHLWEKFERQQQQPFCRECAHFANMYYYNTKKRQIAAACRVQRDGRRRTDDDEEGCPSANGIYLNTSFGDKGHCLQKFRRLSSVFSYKIWVIEKKIAFWQVAPLCQECTLIDWVLQSHI